MPGSVLQVMNSYSNTTQWKQLQQRQQLLGLEPWHSLMWLWLSKHIRLYNLNGCRITHVSDAPQIMDFKNTGISLVPPVWPLNVLCHCPMESLQWLHIVGGFIILWGTWITETLRCWLKLLNYEVEQLKLNPVGWTYCLYEFSLIIKPWDKLLKALSPKNAMLEAFVVD